MSRSGEKLKDKDYASIVTRLRPSKQSLHGQRPINTLTSKESSSKSPATIPPPTTNSPDVSNRDNIKDQLQASPNAKKRLDSLKTMQSLLGKANPSSPRHSTRLTDSIIHSPRYSLSSLSSSSLSPSSRRVARDCFEEPIDPRLLEVPPEYIASIALISFRYNKETLSHNSVKNRYFLNVSRDNNYLYITNNTEICDKCFLIRQKHLKRLAFSNESVVIELNQNRGVIVAVHHSNDTAFRDYFNSHPVWNVDTSKTIKDVKVIEDRIERAVNPFRSAIFGKASRTTRAKARESMGGDSELTPIELGEDEPNSIFLEDDFQPYEVPADFSPDLKYAFDETKVFTIAYSDFKTLYNNDWVNDTIIDFFIQYEIHQALDSNKFLDPKDFHAFNSFFFTKLMTKSSTDPTQTPDYYNNIKRWLTKLDLMSFPYVILPINEGAHWYCCIIRGLDDLLEAAIKEKSKEGIKKEEHESVILSDGTPPARSPPLSQQQDPEFDFEFTSDTDSKQQEGITTPKSKQLLKRPSRPATIYVFDSLAYKRHNINIPIKRFIIDYCQDKYGVNIRKDQIIVINAKVARQNNLSDCGIHVIYNVRKWINNISECERIWRKPQASNNEVRSFFIPEERKGMRKELIKILLDLHAQQQQRQDKDGHKIRIEHEEDDDDVIEIREHTPVPSALPLPPLPSPPPPLPRMLVTEAEIQEDVPMSDAQSKDRNIKEPAISVTESDPKERSSRKIENEENDTGMSQDPNETTKPEADADGDIFMTPEEGQSNTSKTGSPRDDDSDVIMTPTDESQQSEEIDQRAEISDMQEKETPSRKQASPEEEIDDEVVIVKDKSRAKYEFRSLDPRIIDTPDHSMEYERFKNSHLNESFPLAMIIPDNILQTVNELIPKSNINVSDEVIELIESYIGAGKEAFQFQKQNFLKQYQDIIENEKAMVDSTRPSNQDFEIRPFLASDTIVSETDSEGMVINQEENDESDGMKHSISENAHGVAQLAITESSTRKSKSEEGIKTPKRLLISEPFESPKDKGLDDATRPKEVNSKYETLGPVRIERRSREDGKEKDVIEIENPNISPGSRSRKISTDNSTPKAKLSKSPSWYRPRNTKSSSNSPKASKHSPPPLPPPPSPPPPPTRGRIKQHPEVIHIDGSQDDSVQTKDSQQPRSTSSLTNPINLEDEINGRNQETAISKSQLKRNDPNRPVRSTRKEVKYLDTRPYKRSPTPPVVPKKETPPESKPHEIVEIIDPEPPKTNNDKPRISGHETRSKTGVVNEINYNPSRKNGGRKKGKKPDKKEPIVVSDDERPLPPPPGPPPGQPLGPPPGSPPPSSRSGSTERKNQKPPIGWARFPLEDNSVGPITSEINKANRSHSEDTVVEDSHGGGSSSSSSSSSGGGGGSSSGGDDKYDDDDLATNILKRKLDDHDRGVSNEGGSSSPRLPRDRDYIAQGRSSSTERDYFSVNIKYAKSKSDKDQAYKKRKHQ
ncbi:uncharacterized protein J8A68_002780 [[Candida] subhashii]|uniref:Ubiquitin-like protease family profile domain-containing protein n=1 Tax=[Candida] subhashii TaxID=561895 RepID=A0A8J5V034_9ASCO|nr:uncharacterized protein J8A68_002780 [[Candida] subhashii]KAG7663694.1 hypothetical protein J8A68_002780 [[Candida] subhashii]